MLTRMQQRRGLASEWSDSVISSTVILAAGEVGLETDTGRFKLGNGTTVWANLPYYLPDNNPTNSTSRIGKNNHDIYSKLSPLGPGYSQTFTGGNVMIPQSGSQTPLVVAGLVGQTALLQSWRSNISNTTPVASISSAGKLTAFGAEFNAAVDMNSSKIIDLGTPTADADAATKLYVDQAIAGLAWKAPVNLISASGLDTYINVALTGNTNTLVLDGHDALTQAHGNGYRILLLAQTDPAENGIYVYSDNGTTYTLARSTDADTLAELKGASVFVQEGTNYGTSSWVQTNHYAADFDEQDWVQFNGASQIVADGGLTKVGNTLAVGGTTDRIHINTNSVDISANYVGQTSITTLGTVTTGTWTADTIAADQGGTGQSSYTVGDILYASSTSALSKLPAGTLNYPLISGGTATDPLYGQIVTDAIADSSSTTTGVTYSKIQYVSAANKILGRISSGSGLIEELNADNVISIVNGGTSEFSISRIPTGTTSSTVALGDHTHTIDQLSDVVITGTPAVRQVIKYNGSSWVNELPSGGISTGPTPPDSPSNGDAWFDTTDGSLYVRYDDGVADVRTNLISNPSFETNLDGWTYSAMGTATRTTAESYSGTASVLLDYTASQPRYFYQNISVTAGETYTASAYVKQLTSTNNFSVAIDWRDSSGNSINEEQSYAVYANTSGWTRSSLTMIAPAGAINARVGIYNQSDHYIDAVMFEQSAILGDYIEGTVSAGSSAQWVQVKANSALEASILTRMSAVEARDTKLEAANAVRVANQTERDATYPSPVQGNTVFRADLGYEEKYYAAYNSSTNPDGTTGTIGWYRYAGGAPLSQNYILNGDMEINQRGLTSTPITPFTSSYGLDRWKAYLASDHRLSIQTASITGVPIRYAARMGSNTTINATGGLLPFGQKIESKNVIPLRGKTVTVSFYVKFNSATFTASSGVYTSFQYRLGYDTTTTDSSFSDPSFDSVATAVIVNGSLPTSWTRVSLTGTVPATANNISVTTQFLSLSGFAYTTTADAHYYDITGVQLEEGPVATPFRRNQENIQAELAACQRYYQRITATTTTDVMIGPGVQYAANAAQGVVSLSPMRSSVSSIDQNSVTWTDVYSGAWGGTVTLRSSTNDSSSVTLRIAPGFDFGASGRFGSFVLASGAYIGFSAEL